MNVYKVSRSFTSTNVYRVEAKDEEEAVKLIGGDSSEYVGYYNSCDDDYHHVVQDYDDQSTKQALAGRRIITKHEHRFMESAFKSAQYACEWIQREAHWGCLPNMDSPRAETKEQDSTTMDAVDSAQDFLNYLKYDLKEDLTHESQIHKLEENAHFAFCDIQRIEKRLKVLETSTNMLAQAKGDES